MRFIRTVALLAGIAHAGPALQHPLVPNPCATIAATRIVPIDDDPDPSPTSEPEEPCPTPTLTTVTFEELAPTFYGEEIYLTGNITDLGEWNTSSALHLNSSEYTAENPLWYVTVELPVDLVFEYKYIKKEPDGSVVWESDPNRLYTVEGNCEGNVTEKDSWR